MSVKFLLNFVDETGKTQRSERFEQKVEDHIQTIQDAFEAVKKNNGFLNDVQSVDGVFWVDGRQFHGGMPVMNGYLYKAQINVNSADYPLTSPTTAIQKRTISKARELTDREKELDPKNLIPVYVGSPDFPKTPVIREVIMHRGATVNCVLKTAFDKGMIPIKPEGLMKQVNSITNEEKIVNQDDVAIPEHIYIPI